MVKTDVAGWFSQTKGDYVNDAREGAVWSAINMNKSFEYLHKQLVRKGGYSAENGGIGANAGFLDTAVGRVYFVRQYFCYTGGTQPYNYGGIKDLGLSQFFNNQSVRGAFTGDDGVTNDKHWVIQGQKSFDEKKINPSDYGKIVASGSTKFDTGIIDQNKNPIYADADWYLTDGGYVVEHRKFKTHTNSYVYPAFWADNDLPIEGVRKFIKNWSSKFSVIYYVGKKEQRRKNRAWYGRRVTIKGALSGIITVGSLALAGMTYGAASAALAAGWSGIASASGLASIGGFLGALGTFVYSFGGAVGIKAMVKGGKFLGIVASVMSLPSLVRSFFAAAGATAAANASTLTNSAVATSQGLGQTSSLYNGFAMSSELTRAGVFSGTSALAGSAGGVLGSAGATSLGAYSYANAGLANFSGANFASVGASNYNSVMFSTPQNAFKSALIGQNISPAASAAVQNSQIYLTNTLKLASQIKDAADAVNNIIGAFRQAGSYKDEDIEDNSAQTGEVVAQSSDEEYELGQRRFYERDEEYDLGLEAGTPMSNDNSLLKI